MLTPTWSKEPPKEPGLYVWRDISYGKIHGYGVSKIFLCDGILYDVEDDYPLDRQEDENYTVEWLSMPIPE